NSPEPASGILKGLKTTLEDARRSLWRNITIATLAVKVYVCSVPIDYFSNCRRVVNSFKEPKVRIHLKAKIIFNELARPV
ncbi:hypothetical protein L9F63_002110, partial [Diploptera punctata]